jgi:Short C-terminal domain
MGLFGPLMIGAVLGRSDPARGVGGERAFTGPRGDRHDSPVDILKRRLASGEISQDQYEQARKALQG